MKQVQWTTALTNTGVTEVRKSHIVAWGLAVALSYIISDGFEFGGVIAPLLVVASLALFLTRHRLKHIEYLLFFLISIASLLGFTQTLTGAHEKSSSVLLTGLSFYTASIAYHVASNRFNFDKVLSVSNPLLLSTGPIVLFFRDISHRSLKKRFEYYFPFVIVGIFMFQVVASPLTEFFVLLERTDGVSSLVFAAIFELFVYMNFCGLSLLIYGIFGLIGYRIPLNFKQPFSSSNIVEFWRGWHTSLSEVLKVLFYQPLRTQFSPFFALLGVFIASAMWHGVSLNFLMWGSFHALLFWLSVRLIKRGHSMFALILMPFIIIVGRLLFSDSDTERLLQKLRFSFSGLRGDSSLLIAHSHSLLALLIGAAIVWVEFSFRKTRVMRKRNYKYLRTPFALLVLSVLGVLFASNVGMDYAVYGQR